MNKANIEGGGPLEGGPPQQQRDEVQVQGLSVWHRCEHRGQSAIDTKLHLLDLHVQAEHAQPAPAPSAQPATHRRKPEKFPRPTVGVDETREGWENFNLYWAQ